MRARRFRRGSTPSGSSRITGDRLRSRLDGTGAYEARQFATRIEATRGAARRPCHNDLLNANFLDDGERIRIVDWEYAGMGDVFFDLANFAINHELDADASGALLEAYFGEVRAEDERALALMRFMSDFREAMWGVVQTGVSELDFDFAGVRERALRADGANGGRVLRFVAALEA